MKGYKTDIYSRSIEEVEITKMTDHFYYVDGHRISKNSQDEFIGETKEKVKEKYIKYINNEIDNLEHQIKYQQSKLGKIQSL